MFFLHMVLTAMTWLLAYFCAALSLMGAGILLYVLLVFWVLNPLSRWRMERHIDKLTKSGHIRRSPLDV